LGSEPAAKLIKVASSRWCVMVIRGPRVRRAPFDTRCASAI
jgi:hypothetical protein